MAKRLLIMALVAVQCASWSGASLFLCLGADGSVCIDGGPDSCTSCHDEVRHACCDLHDACGHCVRWDVPTDRRASGGHSPPYDDSAMCNAGAPCDCTHVQIAQSQAPSVVAKSVAQSGFSRAAAFVVPMAVDHHSFSVACHDVAWRTRGGPSLAPSLLLTTVDVAVINC